MSRMIKIVYIHSINFFKIYNIMWCTDPNPSHFIFLKSILLIIFIFFQSSEKITLLARAKHNDDNHNPHPHPHPKP